MNNFYFAYDKNEKSVKHDKRKYVSKICYYHIFNLLFLLYYFKQLFL